MGRYRKYNGFQSVQKKWRKTLHFAATWWSEEFRGPICHWALTWSSGKYASDKIPACRYVPGLVWSAWLGCAQQGARTDLISHIHGQMTPPLPVAAYERWPTGLRPSGRDNNSSGCQCCSWTFPRKLPFVCLSIPGKEKYFAFLRRGFVVLFFCVVQLLISYRAAFLHRLSPCWGDSVSSVCQWASRRTDLIPVFG